MNTGIEKGGQFLKESLFKRSLSMRLRFSRDLIFFGVGDSYIEFAISDAVFAEKSGLGSLSRLSPECPYLVTI